MPRERYSICVTTKATTANALSVQQAKGVATIDEHLEEMALIRKRMKSTDGRIRRADASIRQSLDETWDLLRRVQANR